MNKFKIRKTNLLIVFILSTICLSFLFATTLAEIAPISRAHGNFLFPNMVADIFFSFTLYLLAIIASIAGMVMITQRKPKMAYVTLCITGILVSFRMFIYGMTNLCIKGINLFECQKSQLWMPIFLLFIILLSLFAILLFAGAGAILFLIKDNNKRRLFFSIIFGIAALTLVTIFSFYFAIYVMSLYISGTPGSMFPVPDSLLLLMTLINVGPLLVSISLISIALTSSPLVDKMVEENIKFEEDKLESKEEVKEDKTSQEPEKIVSEEK